MHNTQRGSKKGAKAQILICAAGALYLLSEAPPVSEFSESATEFSFACNAEPNLGNCDDATAADQPRERDCGRRAIVCYPDLRKIGSLTKLLAPSGVRTGMSLAFKQSF